MKNQSETTYLFLVSKYPNISETFIYDQITTLRENGFSVKLASIRTPCHAEVHPYMSNNDKHITYLDSQQLFMLLCAQLYCIFKFPAKYYGSIISILFSTYYSGKRCKTLLHFIGATFLAHTFKSYKKLHIHAHFAYSGLSVAYWLAHLRASQYSVTVHGSDILMTDDLPERELLTASRIIHISHYNQEYLQKQLPQLALEKTEVIPLGIDTEKFRAAPATPSHNEFIIINIGRLIPAKGQKYLIRACKILSDKNIPYKCYIAGTGPLNEYLQSEITRLGLSDAVSLLGHVYSDKVVELYNLADTFVLSSVSEGIPVVIMEALAMTVPVVASDITGIPEIITDGENGLLVASKDPAAIADSVMYLYSNQPFRKKITQNGRFTIINSFQITTNSLKFANTIRHIY